MTHFWRNRSMLFGNYLSSATQRSRGLQGFIYGLQRESQDYYSHVFFQTVPTCLIDTYSCEEVGNRATYQNTTFGPHSHFGTIAYWSRGFWYNRPRLLIGQELALDLGFSSRTASNATTICSRLVTVHQGVTKNQKLLKSICYFACGCLYTYTYKSRIKKNWEFSGL